MLMILNINSEYASGAEHARVLNFPLRISSVNVIKSAKNGGFGHLY